MSMASAQLQGKMLAESVSLDGEEPIVQIAEAIASLMQYSKACDIDEHTLMLKVYGYMMADHEGEDE